ncbi:MAG TPA: hypothetical protein VKZ99_03495 [Gammaproteobacteria bacterium]|nr:hypothetical protein [Gammaproteobacteria bacterium]
MARYGQSSLLAAALWMIVVSLLLFFLPGINGLIGGGVGGYKAGSVGRGLGAAVLPALVVGLLVWVLLAMFNMPVIGFISGVAVGLWALFSSIGLLVGAIIGGALAPSRPDIIEMPRR